MIEKKKIEKWDSSYSGAYQRASEVTYLTLFYTLSLQFVIKAYCWASCLHSINLSYSESVPESHLFLRYNKINIQAGSFKIISICSIRLLLRYVSKFSMRQIILSTLLMVRLVVFSVLFFKIYFFHVTKNYRCEIFTFAPGIDYIQTIYYPIDAPI